MGGVAVAGVVAFVVASGSERTPDPQPVANVVVPPDSAAPPPPSPVPEPAIEQPSALSAARASTNVPPPPPKDAFDEHLETARQAFAAGQYARAVTAAEQALGLRRADPAALALVVRAACKLEDSAKAIRHAKYVAAARRKALVTECTADGVALDPEAFAWTDGATRKWTGAWANQGWRFTFTLELTRNALELGGAFTWRLDEAPPDQRQDNVGQSAKEFLRGTYEPAAGRVRVRGVGMSAPDVIGLDSYDLKIAADGLISGKTRTNAGNWSGRISAILVK
jgi:hypothetical protein